MVKLSPGILKIPDNFLFPWGFPSAPSMEKAPSASIERFASQFVTPVTDAFIVPTGVCPNSGRLPKSIPRNRNKRMCTRFFIVVTKSNVVSFVALFLFLFVLPSFFCNMHCVVFEDEFPCKCGPRYVCYIHEHTLRLLDFVVPSPQAALRIK